MRHRILPAIVAATQRRSAPAPVDPLASLSADFAGGDTLAGWAAYKPDAAVASVGGSGLVLAAAAGGGGDYISAPAPGSSFWFSPSNADQRSGYLVYREVDSSAFDVRARINATAGDGSSAVPATVGEWRFVVLAIHDPDRTSYLRYLHVGLGSEGGAAVTGVETKVNRVNAAGGASVFPVAAASMDSDLRIVRTSAQVFVVYHRPISSGEELASDAGWTLLYTIDWADGEDAADDFPACPQETDAGLPDAVHVGFAVYSNAAAVDLQATVSEVIFASLA